jgi:uncharacterized hydrophobic protein (TIGR00271 family)
VLTALRAQVLPAHQRRSLEELTLELDPGAGDVVAKRSAFWVMLTLSAVIASAGVLSDSTATVIGAMIIAPLSTPIMGIALAIVKRERPSVIVTVALGSALVVLIGVAFAALLPGSYNLHANSQITGRTSPGMLDLLAAVATGFAGAIGLARKDVAAVLPGVAIAISLVPPLAVVGVCLGSSDGELALGASFLFLSNLLSMVVAGTVVFAVLGYAEHDRDSRGRRVRLVLTALLVGVTLPLLVNTGVSVTMSVWTSRVETAAEEWVSAVPGAEVTGVDNRSTTFVIQVRTPSALPPTQDLLDALADELPARVDIVIETTTGERLDLGSVGDG